MCFFHPGVNAWCLFTPTLINGDLSNKLMLVPSLASGSLPLLMQSACEKMSETYESDRDPVKKHQWHLFPCSLRIANKPLPFELPFCMALLWLVPTFSADFRGFRLKNAGKVATLRFSFCIRCPLVRYIKLSLFAAQPIDKLVSCCSSSFPACPRPPRRYTGLL